MKAKERKSKKNTELLLKWMDGLTEYKEPTLTEHENGLFIYEIDLRLSDINGTTHPMDRKSRML